MKKYRSFLLLSAAIALFLVAKYFYFKPKFSTGINAPDISATLTSGEEFNLTSLQGSYVLLDFWGSWCGPCRAQSPKLVSIYNEFHGQEYQDAEDFEIVSIAIETHEESWKRAIIKDKLDWKYHILQLDRFKSDIPSDYGVREIPTNYLLDEKGQIVGVNMSYEEWKNYLSERIVGLR